MTPHTLATLECILADPRQVEALPREQAAALFAHLAAAQAALATRLHGAAAREEVGGTAVDADRLLMPQATAERLGVTVRWLYRHASDLPFTRKLSRKTLRFSERGLIAYLSGRHR